MGIYRRQIGREMSKHVYYYKVQKVEEDLATVRNLDTAPFPEEYAYTNVTNASDWEQEIGQACTIQYQTVNTFKAASEIFGTKIRSMTYNWHDQSETCYDDNGNRAGTLTSQMLDPFRYIKEEQVYVYRQELIARPDSWYIFDPKEGVVTQNDVYEMLRACVVYGEECYTYSVGEAVYELTKVLLALQDGAMVVCEFC